MKTTDANPFVAQLAAELDGWDFKSNDVERWVEYLPLAARLASLGIPKYLERYTQSWPKEASISYDALVIAFIERAHEGKQDLYCQVGGDPLALAVSEAQDWHLLLERLQWLPSDCKRELEAWVEAVELMGPDLDSDTITVLARHADCFPFPDYERIFPTTTPEHGELAEFVRTGKWVKFLRWPDGSRAALREVFTEAETPSPDLRAAFERLDCRIPTDQGWIMVKHLALTPDWNLQVIVTAKAHDESDIPVVSVRIERCLAKRLASGYWTIDLKVARPQIRKRLSLLQDHHLRITFGDGTEVAFPGVYPRIGIGKSY